MTTPSDNTTWQELQLGQDHDDLILTSSEENQSVAVHMAQQGTHTLDLYSMALDPRIYDHNDFIEAVRSMVVHNPRAQVRFLIVDPDTVIKHGHQLVELARRLTSRFELRKVHADFASFPESYLVIDRRGVLHRKLASRFEAIANFNNPALAAELTKHFNEVWDHSSADLNLKRLYI